MIGSDARFGFLHLSNWLKACIRKVFCFPGGAEVAM